MPILHIQGIDAEYRALKESSVSEDGELIEGEEILYADLPQDEQYFRRTEIPFTDDDLVAIVNKEHTYTALQTKWVEREKDRMTHGVHAMINGTLTFISGAMYGYVNYWTLETGDKPDYRNCTRKIFILKEYLIRDDVPVLAMTRGKSRRKGATTEGTFFEWWICGRNKEKIGGMVSYNDDSIKKIFQMLFLRGFRALLPCFVEDMDGSSETYVKFIKSVEKKKKGVNIKREGLNSYIDFMPTTINSYDSGRVSYLLGDEWGKWEKVDINAYWSKVKSCLRKGKKKVGFAYIPTTVNPKKKGGENFRKFWEAADQNAINPRTGNPYGIHTPSKVVRIFDSALEGYAGCIDKFGESVIDDPLEPVMGNDGDWITEGSRSVILKEREGLKDKELMDHRRDHPIDEWDMFAFEIGSCEFIEENFIDRITHLERNKAEAFWRQGRLYEEYDSLKKKTIVKWADDPKGDCFSQGFPEEDNLYTDTNGTIEPLNGSMYSIGADTYKNIFAEGGSDGAISVIKKSCIINGIETGLKPVFFYVGRPRLIKQFNRQMFLTCLFFGAKVNVEIDAGTWFYEDFLEWDALQCLEWTPAVDLTKPKQKFLPGTQSGNPFELAKQLEVAKLYFDGNSMLVYNGNVHRVTYIPLLKEGLQYNHAERTPFHLMVSFMMALLPILGRPRPRGGEKSSQKPKYIMPQKKIKLPS
jgi:hypothetical protein